MRRSDLQIGKTYTEDNEVGPYKVLYKSSDWVYCIWPYGTSEIVIRWLGYSFCHGIQEYETK